MPSPLCQHDDRVPVPVWGRAAHFAGREFAYRRRTACGSLARVTGTGRTVLACRRAVEER